MKTFLLSAILVLGFTLLNPTKAHAQANGHYFCYETWIEECGDAINAADTDENSAAQVASTYDRSDSAWCFEYIIALNGRQVLQDTYYFFQIQFIFFPVSYSLWNDIYYYYQMRVLNSIHSECPGYTGYEVSSLWP